MSFSELARMLRTERLFPIAKTLLLPLVYLCLLGAVSHHLYKTPIYRMDAIQYMGNALLMGNTDIVRIHEQVYSEVVRSVPGPELANLLGHQVGGRTDQNRSRALRSR